IYFLKFFVLFLGSDFFFNQFIFGMPVETDEKTDRKNANRKRNEVVEKEAPPDVVTRSNFYFDRSPLGDIGHQEKGSGKNREQNRYRSFIGAQHGKCTNTCRNEEQI